jgi:acetyl esterase/lipase
LVGVRLAQCGFSVAVLGYDRWPLADATQQASEVGKAIEWLLEKSPQRSDLGFDRRRVVLFGHSSGGHVAMLWLLSNLCSNATAANSLAAVVTLGSPFDITDHERHERRRGVADISALGPACGLPSFDLVSPNKIARELATTEGLRRLWRLGSRSALRPARICLLHGAADTTVPCSAATKLYHSLAALGLGSLSLIDKRDVKLLPDGGHSTDLINIMLGKDCQTVRTLLELASSS